MSYCNDFISVTRDLHRQEIKSLTVIRYTNENRTLLTHDYFWQQQNNFTTFVSH